MPVNFASAAQAQPQDASQKTPPTREQKSAGEASAPEFRSIADVFDFVIHYYHNPQPQGLVPALKTILESDLWEKATPADELQFACFFGIAAGTEPNVVAGYKNLFAPTTHKRRLFILKILQLCGNKDVSDYFRQEMKAGRFANERGSIEEMLDEGIPMSVEALSKLVGPAGRIYICWGQFMATGKAEAIDGLISELEFTDPNMSAEDVNSIREAASNTLRDMCSVNADMMAICKQRLENLKGAAGTRLEDIIDFVDGSISAKRIVEHPPQLQPATGPKAWAIGCSAVLIERNHDRLDTLATNKITEPQVNSLRGTLNEWWGVQSKRDLLDTLASLEQKGHRSRFDYVVGKVADLNDQQYKVIIDLTTDADAANEMRVARKYGKQLGKKSILGWDFTRYVSLCRWGYTIGLLSEQEAWDKIMPAARKLQRTFDSWEDLGCNYLIGRQFWSYKETAKDSYLYEDAIQRLLDMPSSPWNKYPWNMDLGPGKDANDANEIDKN